MARRILAVLVAATLHGPTAGTLLTAAQRDPTSDPLAPASADVSAGGRYIAFESLARLVPADTNDRRDVYVLDLDTRLVTLESHHPGAWLDDARPRVSADGRFLVYESTPAASLDGAFNTQIVWCDRTTGSSRILSLAPDGAAASGPSRTPDISDDGQVVVFVSNAVNLVAGADANGQGDDVYAVDLRTGRTVRVSVDSAGTQAATGVSITPSLSGDGRWVAFASSAPLAASRGPRHASSDRVEPRQIFARDLQTGRTLRVSESGEGGAADGASWNPAINRDGRFVAFVSDARNLGGGARNRTADVFVHDRTTRRITLVSRAADGGEAGGASAAPAISADGRFVAFQSDAPNLVCDRRCTKALEDINLLWDVFLFDAASGTTSRLSGDADGEWMEASRGPSIDGSGTVRAFASRHPIDALDRRDDYDLFVSAPDRVVRTGRE